MPEKTIFRQSAILSYKRSMEKDVVPHLISWPIIVCLWILMGVLLSAGFFAWYAQVPTYVNGSGIILARGNTLQPQYENMEVIVFFSPDQSTSLRVGLPVDMQIGSTGMHIQSTIAQVEAGIMSPDTARQRYQLDSAGASLITQPSRVAIIKLPTAQLATAYAGSLLTARVEVGSQSLLSLLPSLGLFLGSSS